MRDRNRYDALMRDLEDAAYCGGSLAGLAKREEKEEARMNYSLKIIQIRLISKIYRKSWGLSSHNHNHKPLTPPYS